ncbi:MAG: hypothetical protein RLY70_1600 [Planctomycetota bacterium]
MSLDRQAWIEQTRRRFLTSSASGLGAAALAAILSEDGVLRPAAGAEPANGDLSTLTAGGPSASNPFAPRPPHFAPKAKNCIFLFQAGAPSHLDLFNPKPKLNELDGKPLPKEMLEKVRFAFIKKDSAVLLGSPRKWSKHGQCGMDFSDFLPNIATCADDILMIRSMYSEQFNHHPGQLLLSCGRATFGLPTMGSWLTYGLGTESRDLPGYVVLTSGRGSSGGASLWSSGFMPSHYAGVLFRNQGEPVLNLANPAGLPAEQQRRGLDTLKSLNSRRFEEMGDPEIASRIASYELAFRMQSAAPELIDLKSESATMLDAYGVGRAQHPQATGRGNVDNAHLSFARNCLLARRMVERGVRFVNIIYEAWDQHSNLEGDLRYNSWVVDQPVAALLKDLKQRGLLDSTLVVWGAEFGRTPLGENRNGREANTGRDHHPFSFTLWMAGGGIKGGQVYGDSDEIGWGVARDPVHVNDFHATMLHLFGLDHLKLTSRFQGRDFRLTDVGGKVMTPWLA